MTVLETWPRQRSTYLEVGKLENEQITIVFRKDEGISKDLSLLNYGSAKKSCSITFKLHETQVQLTIGKLF